MAFFNALAVEVAVSHAKVAEAEARYRAEQFGEPAKAALTLRQLTQEQEALTRLQERAARLVGYAESEGILVVATAQDMNTRFFKQGALVGYILDAEQLKVRAVVSQDDIDLVRSRLKNIDIRLSENVMFQHPAMAIRELPSGVNELPSSALALSGGGTIATNPNDSNGTKTLERVFLFDLKPTSLKLPATFGERVYVRFQHGYEPLGFQGLRRLRQLFLSHFHV